MRIILIILSISLISIKTSAQAGEELFKANCTACHSLTERMTGPPLTFISDYKDFEWFYDFKVNPLSFYKTEKDKYTTRMLDYWTPRCGLDPPVDLSKEEIKQIWDFLKDLKSVSIRHAETDSLRQSWSK